MPAKCRSCTDGDKKAGSGKKDCKRCGGTGVGTTWKR